MAATALLVWLSLFVFGMSKAGPDGIMRISGGYKYDANDLCVVVLVGLALCLLTFQTSKVTGKLFSLLVLVGIGMTIAKSGSRGGFVGLAAEGLALLICLHTVPLVKRVAFIAVVIAGLFLSAPPGYWNQMSSILSPKKDYNWDSYGGRRKVAKRGIGYMMMYPVFGIGTNNFPMAEGTISERAKQFRPGDPGIRWMAPHNSYLEAGAEMGIPGGLLWAGLVLGGIVAMYRLSRRLPRSWLHGDTEERFLYQAAMYLPVGITGFAFSAFFVSFTYLDPVYILAALMVGVYLSVDRKLRESPAGSVRVLHRGAAAREARPGRYPATTPPSGTLQPPSTARGA